MDIEGIKRIFKYDPKTGYLYWHKRDRSDFKSDRSYKMWNTRFKGKRVDHITKAGYYSVRIDGKPYLVHRIVWVICYGYWPKNIDHIDGNPLNNKLENLQECNQQQNNMNRGLQSNNTSGINGVTWSKALNKWRAKIQYKRKWVHVGLFDDKLVAKQAIENKAKELGFSDRHGK